MAGVLSGVKVIELAGLGPAPFCCMLLADMGADVIRVERPGAAKQLKPSDVLARGRRVVELDLKADSGKDALRAMIQRADVLIEGYRPGVMERLGFGPEVCHADNPKLVFARMTGWGQHGPLASRAGHDINYIAISGALSAIGPADGPPSIPLNLIGDFGGGGMMLAMGVLAAVIHARSSGQGQVIDAAMTDGTALLTSMMWGFMQSGQWQNDRGVNFLDGAAHFYTTYECADGKHLSVGAIEPQFYAALLKGCGLSEQEMPGPYRDGNTWQPSKEKLAAIFKQKTRDAWCDWFEGQDVCIAPVLDWEEALHHSHNIARETFIVLDGVTQPAPAPRFERTPSEARSFQVDVDVDSVLKDWS
jgi:alpha-methylacyl-CoA racemase